MKGTVLDIPCTTIDHQETRLADLQGKAYLIVNTASKCGFTPQYKGLEALSQAYSKRGLRVVGFPCNQFGAQEPGSDSDIAEFCDLNYGVSFALFSKLDVNGTNAHPLFVRLKEEAPGLLGSKGIKWNFTKFLVNAEGKVLKRYAPSTSPADLTGDIEALLD